LLSRSEARQALGIADDAKVVLFAGAFDNAVKDAPLAQEAVMVLKRMISQPLEGVDSSGMLLMLSSNNNNPRFVAELELKELKGFSRVQVNHWMCAANCLLLTSKTEGSPQVIKEAMACGCPIVSVDVGDVAERVDGVEGCYVVRTREPKDIAEALQRALAHEGKTNGRARIQEMGLSNEQVAERLMAIYQSLV
jgi:glycosyltransferase involved in cell wall biosynthesis